MTSSLQFMYRHQPFSCESIKKKKKRKGKLPHFPTNKQSVFWLCCLLDGDALFTLMYDVIFVFLLDNLCAFFVFCCCFFLPCCKVLVVCKCLLLIVFRLFSVPPPPPFLLFLHAVLLFPSSHHRLSHLSSCAQTLRPALNPLLTVGTSPSFFC